MLIYCYKKYGEKMSTMNPIFKYIIRCMDLYLLKLYFYNFIVATIFLFPISLFSFEKDMLPENARIHAYYWDDFSEQMLVLFQNKLIQKDLHLTDQQIRQLFSLNDGWDLYHDEQMKIHDLMKKQHKDKLKSPHLTLEINSLFRDSYLREIKKILSPVQYHRVFEIYLQVYGIINLMVIRTNLPEDMVRKLDISQQQWDRLYDLYYKFYLERKQYAALLGRCSISEWKRTSNEKEKLKVRNEIDDAIKKLSAIEKKYTASVWNVLSKKQKEVFTLLLGEQLSIVWEWEKELKD
ncbi:MAG: hypothetical protein BWY31_03773 [Lentisphaerae bacterium ADurb.Bin242]|nr:MAG: hypothetical protein BWY31_03773 [Lentisphaerae bacterium ADurb.Bin242]